MSQVSDNFVRLNMRNKRGSCKASKRNRLLRNVYSRRRSTFLSEGSCENDTENCHSIKKTENKGGLQNMGLDPLSLSIKAHENNSINNSSLKDTNGISKVACKTAKTTDVLFSNTDDMIRHYAPMCSVHHMTCKVVTVTKASANKGRKFYCCSYPRDQQCRFFLWVEDNPELLTVLCKQSKRNENNNTQSNTYKDSDITHLDYILQRYELYLKTLNAISIQHQVSRYRNRSSYCYQYWNEHQSHLFINCDDLKVLPKLKLSGSKEMIINELLRGLKQLLKISLSILGLFDIDAWTIGKENCDNIHNGDDFGQIDKVFELAELSENENILNASTNSVTFPINEDQRYHNSKIDSSLLSENDSFVASLTSNNKQILTCVNSSMIELSDSDDSDCSYSPATASRSKIDQVLNSNESKVKGRSVVTTHISTLQALNIFYGYSAFREGQEWAINRVLRGQSSLLVMPTGLGKSLCYSLPSLLLPGITIVISPLISLMEDQLNKLPIELPGLVLSSSSVQSSNILNNNNRRVGISQSALDMNEVVNQLLSKRVKVLFVSPEKFCSHSFKKLINLIRCNGSKSNENSHEEIVSLVCVDEAHCLSQWSYNFRPSFLAIRKQIEFLKPPAVLALTATASPIVQMEVMSHLAIPYQNINHIRDNLYRSSVDKAINTCMANDILCASVDKEAYSGLKVLSYSRSNLKLHALRVSDEGEMYSTIVNILKNYALSQTSTKNIIDSDNDFRIKIGSKRKELDDKNLGSVIIYTWRRYDAETIATQLSVAGYHAGCYHAGLTAAQRSHVQQQFESNKLKVIVATVAFGMGIDKSDVNVVIHASLPSSVENYIQETGRAGRNGKTATCYLIYQDLECLTHHALTYSQSISQLQLLGLLYNVFQPIYSKVKSMSNGTSNGCDETCLLVCKPSVCLSLSKLANSLHMSAVAVETILSLLELHLSPNRNIGLVTDDKSKYTVHNHRFYIDVSASSRYDRLQGSFRCDISSYVNMDITNVTIGSQLSKPKVAIVGKNKSTQTSMMLL